MPYNKKKSNDKCGENNREVVRHRICCRFHCCCNNDIYRTPTFPYEYFAELFEWDFFVLFLSYPIDIVDGIEY